MPACDPSSSLAPDLRYTKTVPTSGLQSDLTHPSSIFTAYSLIGHTISGVYKTVNKIIGTLMKILSSFTLDQKYQQERQVRLNRTIKNVKEGIQIGLYNLA